MSKGHIKEMREQMNPIRIGYVTGGLGLGGAERALINQVKSLSEAGISSIVFTFGDGDEMESVINRFAPVIHLGGYQRQTFYRLRRMIDMLLWATHSNIDILHAQNFYSNLYAWIVGKVIGVPTIGSIRGDTLSEVEANGILGFPSLKWPKWLVVNSRSSYQVSLELGRSKDDTFLIENALDFDWFDNVEIESKTLPTDGSLLISVGNLRKPKRFDVLLEAVALVRKDLSDINYWIVGSGPLENELKNKAQNLGLLRDRTVRFLGKRHDVPALLRMADIFLFSSDHEGFPNVVQEALAARLPVIATSVGAIPNMIKNGVNGLLVSPEMPQEFVEKIIYLINNPSRRTQIGENAREYAEQNFSLEKLSWELISVYNRTLRAK